MFVFDTNILSAMMRPERASVVADWIDAQDERRLHTTAISQAEILAGLAAMPDGRRRRAMEAVAEAMFDAFDERVLASMRTPPPPMPGCTRSAAARAAPPRRKI